MPLLDLELLAVKSFRCGILVATLFFFTSPFYPLFAIERQDGAGLDPLHTGLSLLPYCVGLFVGPLASPPVAGAAISTTADHRSDSGSDGLCRDGHHGGVPVGRRAIDRDGVRGRLLPGHCDAAAFQHGPGRCAPRRSRRRGCEFNPADRCGDQRSGCGHAVLRRAWRGRGLTAYEHAFGIAMIAVVSALGGAALLSL